MEKNVLFHKETALSFLFQTQKKNGHNSRKNVKDMGKKRKQMQ